MKIFYFNKFLQVTDFNKDLDFHSDIVIPEPNDQYEQKNCTLKSRIYSQIIAYMLLWKEIIMNIFMNLFKTERPT